MADACKRFEELGVDFVKRPDEGKMRWVVIGGAMVGHPHFLHGEERCWVWTL